MSLSKLCNEQPPSAEASRGFSGHPAERLRGPAISVAKKHHRKYITAEGKLTAFFQNASKDSKDIVSPGRLKYLAGRLDVQVPRQKFCNEDYPQELQFSSLVPRITE